MVAAQTAVKRTMSPACSWSLSTNWITSCAADSSFGGRVESWVSWFGSPEVPITRVWKTNTTIVLIICCLLPSERHGQRLQKTLKNYSAFTFRAWKNLVVRAGLTDLAHWVNQVLLFVIKYWVRAGLGALRVWTQKAFYKIFHQYQVKGSQTGWKLFLESSLRRRASESGQRKQEHRLLPRPNVESVSIPGTYTGTGTGHRLWAWSLQNLQRVARWYFSDASLVD